MEIGLLEILDIVIIVMLLGVMIYTDYRTQEV